MSLTIIAHITAKPEHIALVKNELQKLIAPTRLEEGCISYDLHQDNQDPAHFVFFEKWSSHALWQVHMNNQPLKDYLAAVDGAVADFQISEMTAID
ncbi:hypothetical protein VST7929_01430 [Vibrio stylophorae]|uniref:ABM domain-containing protein n=2 Tax=Vibrio stylophorae TaxID=659351 RepID=A0ABM8ZUB9_9VIBR|nr:hypothetical protein VST7929_01430 [Vibrio stylophorae]